MHGGQVCSSKPLLCLSIAKVIESMSRKTITKVCHRRDNYGTCIETVDVEIWEGISGYFFRAKMAVDVDGGPHAYHPEDYYPNNIAKSYDYLDNLSLSDRHGIQGETGVGPANGFIVSGTSASDDRFPSNDTRHWVNAEIIPYIVLTGKFPNAEGFPLIAKGDAALVADLKTGFWSPAVFADYGRAVGESSLALAWNMGLDPTKSKRPPKVTGYDEQRFVYLAFPNANVDPPWPLPAIHDKVAEQFRVWGDGTGFVDCFRNFQVRNKQSQLDHLYSILKVVKRSLI